MSLYLINLDDRTRELMLEEVEYDTERSQLHISPYLSNQGAFDFPALLRRAIREGDAESLGQALAAQGRIARTGHRRKTSGGYTIVTIPENAAEKPDQGEILAVGNGKVGDDGKVRALAVKVGDKVLFGQYAGSTVKIDGEELLILSESEIFGVLEG